LDSYFGTWYFGYLLMVIGWIMVIRLMVIWLTA